MAKKPAGSDEQSTSAYFRKIFEENRELLKGRSNQEVLNRWLADNPGHRKVPGNIKGTLSNVKSILRRKRRRRVRRQEAEQSATGMPLATKKPVRGLTLLEEQIDDCLTAA